MARSNEPLHSLQRDSIDASSESDVAEGDALLTGQYTTRDGRERRDLKFWRELGLFSWALLATAAVVILGVVFSKQHQQGEGAPLNRRPSGKRNLIFMVSDGMGPTSLSLTRSFRQHESNLHIDDILTLDQHLIGQSRTRSTSSLVTDSAAGATAFSCGEKSYNGAISVLPDHSPCGTVLEAAKRAGYMTGLVVTTRITDATPACFASHVHTRSEEDLIAEQMIGSAHPLGRMVDLMFGGGRCHFLPNTTKHSCRDDDKDIVKMAGKEGFSYIDSREEFNALENGANVDLPMLGLFATKDIPYEIDRRNQNDTYPALDEMARTALRSLSHATKNSDKGFFLMIEGSRIDHAGHGNDPAAQVHEVLAYDKAFAAVLEFLKEDDTPGVVVGTSDHETGGLAVARQLHKSYPDYLWYPGVLSNASHSSERLAHKYHHRLRHGHSEGLEDENRKSEEKEELREFLEEQVKDGLGIHDFHDDEIKTLLDEPDRAAYAFADMVSRRAQIGWSTHGHSAADVNIYASAPHAALALVGNHENTEVGKFLRDYLAVNVEAVTRDLKDAMGDIEVGSDDADNSGSKKMKASGGGWMGRMPEKDERLDGQDHLEKYAGESRRKMKRSGGGDLGCDCGL
jgi:alkaline phosphatase